MANDDIYILNINISIGPDGDLMWIVEHLCFLLNCLLSKPSWQHNSKHIQELLKDNNKKIQALKWPAAFALCGMWRLTAALGSLHVFPVGILCKPSPAFLSLPNPSSAILYGGFAHGGLDVVRQLVFPQCLGFMYRRAVLVLP